MSKNLNVAILGAGFMAQTHAKNLIKFPEVSIRAVCDVTIESAGTLKAIAPDINLYDNFDNMLEKEKLDVLYVCIPPFAHNGQVEKAAEKGIHIFMEKPVAITVERAENMVRCVEKADIITQVGYHMRYGKAVRELKKLIKSGEAGKPTLFDARYECNSLHTNWWRKKDKSGGQVFEQVIHLYDMAMNFLGDCEAVAGYTANLAHTGIEDYTVEDTSVSILKFKNGTLANITGTNCAVPWVWGNPFTVVCENITANFTTGNDAIFYFTKKDPVEEVIIKADCDMYFEETAAFLNAVWGTSNDNVSIFEGLKGLKMVDAVSNSNGNIIKL